MTVGIYSITNTVNNKKYIGRSIDVENRWKSHRYFLRKTERLKKHVNSHLHGAFHLYGEEAFSFEIIEVLENSETILKDREMYWINFYKSYDREFGYNLRRDADGAHIVHDETRLRLSEAMRGESNPNYGNYWTDEMKSGVGKIKREQHASGEIYGDEWRRKIGMKTSEMWKDEDKKARMAERVSLAKVKKRVDQYDKEGNFIRHWSSVNEILKENPEYKWQNVYAACNGSKKSYRGFIWKYVEEELNGN